MGDKRNSGKLFCLVLKMFFAPPSRWDFEKWSSSANDAKYHSWSNARRKTADTDADAHISGIQLKSVRYS